MKIEHSSDHRQERTQDPPIKAVGRLLVVDDLIANRRILRGLLQRFGYDIEEAQDGEEALEMIAAQDFDTILLDIMMPKMDGYEVCHRLKSDHRTEHIPVLLVTALSDRDSRLRGMHAGADEFVSKPFDSKYLPMRIQNAVRSKRLHDQVEENYRKLKESEELRDALIHMIVHDLRSPLFGIHGNLELHGLEQSEMEAGKRETVNNDYVASAHRETKRLIGMVNDLLDVHRMENNQMPVRQAYCHMDGIIAQAIESLGATLDQCRLEVNYATDTTICYTDHDILVRVCSNLLTNAVKFSPDASRIEIQVEGLKSGAMRVSILDEGPGIPAGEEERIFDKFGRLSRHEHRQPSSGLGLNFCKLAIEAHGGLIGVMPREEGGSCFWFDLPGAPDEGEISG